MTAMLTFYNVLDESLVSEDLQHIFLRRSLLHGGVESCAGGTTVPSKNRATVTLSIDDARAGQSEEKEEDFRLRAVWSKVLDYVC
jgi:hypothetical protein